MKRPRLLRFSYWWFVAAALLLFVGAQGIGIWSIQSQKQTIARERARIAKAEDELTPSQKAQRNAQQYLKATFTEIKPQQRLMLDYLQRRYAIDDTFSASKTPVVVPPSSSGKPGELQYVARIASPDSVVREVPSGELEPLSYVTVYAANCDVLPLPKNFWPMVRQNVDRGGYEMTHVILALAFIRDNGCALPADSTEIREKAVAGMLRLAENNTTAPDLRYESIAFLLLAGKPELVKQEWINDIIAAQRTDGGWSFYADGTRSDDHTTMLALWALLAYQDPAKPYEPFIRRPQG